MTSCYAAVLSSTSALSLIHCLRQQQQLSVVDIL